MGEANAGSFDFQGIVSCSAASTKVSGTYVHHPSDGSSARSAIFSGRLPTLTTTEGQVSALRVTNSPRVLEVGLLGAKMSAHSSGSGTTEFRTLSATYQDVRIDGVGLTVKTHTDVFEKFSTKQKLAQGYAASRSLREQLAPYFSSDRPVSTRHRRLPEKRGMILSTIVSELSWQGAPPNGAVIVKNKVILPGFGSIYFGEFFIEQSFRRLTLLRFRFGSTNSGDGAVVELQANGSGWPPRH